MRDLLDLIQRHACRKFSHAVVIKNMHQYFGRRARKSFMFEAYSFAGLECILEVYKWARVERIKSPVEIVFEDGDDNKGALQKLVEFNGYPEPIFRPKKDTNKNGLVIPGFVPLQAADLLANELFQVAKNLPNMDEEKLRHPIKELRNMPQNGMYVSEKGFQSFREMIRQVPALLDLERRVNAHRKKGV